MKLLFDQDSFALHRVGARHTVKITTKPTNAQRGDLIELYAVTLFVRPFKLDSVTGNLFEIPCTDVTYFTVCVIIPS